METTTTELKKKRNGSYNYISNPFDYFVSGSEKKQFTYDIIPNSMPFHVFIGDRGVTLNMMVFATDENMAKNILIDALKFRIQCAKDYEQKKHGKEMLSNADLELLIRNKDRCGETMQVLEFVEKGLHQEKYDIIIQPIQKNQLFKIGWASNDNVLA